LIASGYTGTTLLVYILEFTVTSVALNLLVVWIYQHVPDSLAPMTVIHFAFNFAFKLVIPGGLGLGLTMPLLGWAAGAFSLAAVVVWILQAKQPAGYAVKTF
jgi:hypothetical protein